MLVTKTVKFWSYNILTLQILEDPSIFKDPKLETIASCWKLLMVGEQVLNY